MYNTNQPSMFLKTDFSDNAIDENNQMKINQQKLADAKNMEAMINFDY